MKFSFKSFVGGVIFTSLSVVTVFATSSILSAEFNNTSVIYNGTELDLNGNQMISVTTSENSDVASNYMPVRAVLEQMGYDVDFDEGRNAVIVNNKKYNKLNNEISENNINEQNNTNNSIQLDDFIHEHEMRSYLSNNTNGNLSLAVTDRGVRIGDNNTSNIVLEIPEYEIEHDELGMILVSLDYYNQHIVPLIEQFS